MKALYEKIDRFLTGLFARYGIPSMRIAVGIIFLWFGVLKFAPGLSSAEGLATDTIALLTFNLIAGDLAVTLLAILETVIGVGLILGVFIRPILFLLAFQMVGTFTPLILFPELTWKAAFVPTLEGQYIIKNLVVLAGAMVVGATVRGGGLVAEPKGSNILAAHQA